MSATLLEAGVFLAGSAGALLVVRARAAMHRGLASAAPAAGVAGASR